MVREKFGGGAAQLGLHDKIADILLTATALSAESPGADLFPVAPALLCVESGMRARLFGPDAPDRVLSYLPFQHAPHGRSLVLWLYISLHDNPEL